MRNLSAAIYVSAIAFTPMMWNIRRDLSKARTARWQTLGLYLALVLLLPVLIANILACGVSLCDAERRGELRISSDRNVTATLKGPGGGRVHSAQSPLILGAMLLIFLGYLGFTVLMGWGVSRWTRSPALTLAVLLIVGCGPFLLPLGRYITLNTRRQPLALRHLNDLTIEGFARHPGSPTGHALCQLNAWVPRHRSIHGVAFEPLLPVYQRLATLQGRKLTVRKIGAAWQFHRWTLRPALFELRA